MTSRREATREITRPMFMKNLRNLFPELSSLPHHDTLARLLERIDVCQIEIAHSEMIHKLMRKKKFKSLLIRGCYPIAIDGTQKFCRDYRWDEACLERKVKSKKTDKKKTKEGQEPQPKNEQLCSEKDLVEQKSEEEKKQYYVYVLEANLAFQNGMVIPLMSEILHYGEGQNSKQDCELNAFKRLAKRLKNAFSHLSIMVLLDGLYPNGPIMAICRAYKWDFMIVLQDKSLPCLWKEINAQKTLQPQNRYSFRWGKRRQSFWWVNDLEYLYMCPTTQREKSIRLHVVVCEESWEEVEKNSSEVITKTSRHVWISEQPLHQRTLHDRCNLGARHRWGIEAGILVEKKQGYQYEHCFSYNWNAMCGYHYLMRLAHALNVLALHSYALACYVRDLGVRDLIAFIRSTIAAPWIEPEILQKIAANHGSIKLE